MDTCGRLHWFSFRVGDYFLYFKALIRPVIDVYLCDKHLALPPPPRPLKILIMLEKVKFRDS